jgi:cysteine-rich repeat protein
MRAVTLAGVVLAFVGAVAVLFLGGAPGVRKLTAAEDHHPKGPHCVDLWENAWCQDQKAAGSCTENEVLTKCLGTCGACCIDLGPEDEADLQYCANVHAAGLCWKHSSQCMKTCGNCVLEMKADCSFEDHRIDDVEFCNFDKSYSPVGPSFLTIEHWNDKKWTGPRMASHGEHFAHFDSELSAESDCVFLTTPWGVLPEGAILVFDYNLYTRDFPKAMGTMSLDLLFDRDDHGWEEVWKADPTTCGSDWTTAVVDLDAAVKKHLAGHGTVGELPVKFRFHVRMGNTKLSDMGLDNVQLKSAICGDGVRTFEACDDGNSKSNDGCSSTCDIEPGYRCVPGNGKDSCSKLSVGDGVVTGAETCDDGNTKAKDGCDGGQVESGYYCMHGTGVPSYVHAFKSWDPKHCLDKCQPVAGQSLVYPGPSACFQAPGPSSIHPRAPTGAIYNRMPLLYQAPELLALAKGPLTKTGAKPYSVGFLMLYDASDSEYKALCPSKKFQDQFVQTACFELGYGWGVVGDHMDVLGTDATTMPFVDTGCATTGRKTWDKGFICGGSKSMSGCTECEAACDEAVVVTCYGTGWCGDGFRRHSFEHCDDGNADDGDGCNAACEVEPDYTCTGGEDGLGPDTCTKAVCGDSIRQTGEGCDDGNLAGGDGCSATCKVETGYWCEMKPAGVPDVCTLKGTIRLNPDTMDPSTPLTRTWPFVVTGTLQVMGEGWGTVCHSMFDQKDANNACAQIGATAPVGGMAELDPISLYVQSPGIVAVDYQVGMPAIQFQGGCCTKGKPNGGLFYTCGVDADCNHCDTVVALTCSSEP